MSGIDGTSGSVFMDVDEPTPVERPTSRRSRRRPKIDTANKRRFPGLKGLLFSTVKYAATPSHAWFQETMASGGERGGGLERRRGHRRCRQPYPNDLRVAFWPKPRSDRENVSNGY
jgi:hypothetical protein